MENKKSKKIVFNEEIDSAISGYTLAITFVGIGIFLLNNLDYFGNKTVSIVILSIFSFIGIVGTFIELGKNSLASNQSLFYKIQVYQTGNTLESNYIRIPDFVPHGITEYYDEHNSYNEYHRGINGQKDCYGYYKNIHSPVDIYESQDLLELIPHVIEDIVEVINFYNGE